MIPNFCVGGAPKSGTTAMVSYLRDHPQVFFPDVKEPFYFATDMPGMRESAKIDSESAYRSLFAGVKGDHLAVGDGSTLYLYSDVAIQNAMKWNPSMKFLFMLRRPAEIAHAFHMQMKFHEWENIDDFHEAWLMQDKRLRGEVELPAMCGEAKLLQYKNVGAIGKQLQRAFEIIPPEQRMVILFDDFVSDVRESYEKVCNFLGIDDDGRDSFARENVAMQSRIPQLTGILRSDSVVMVTRLLKQRLGGLPYQLARKFKHSMMFRAAPRKAIDPTFDIELHREFVPEVELLEELLGRDLTHWKIPNAMDKVV